MPDAAPPGLESGPGPVLVRGSHINHAPHPDPTQGGHGRQPPAQEDPYLWLEEVTGDKALAWVKAQNERSLKELGTPEIRPP